MKTTMKTAVKITAKEGQVFFPNLNKDKSVKLGKDGKQYGYVRLQQDEINLENDVHTTNEVSILQQVEEKVGRIYEPGMKLPGNLVSIDSFEPSYDDHEPLQVPVRDENRKETGDMREVTSGGKPVYREVFYDATGTKSDVRFKYDEVKEDAANKIAAKSAEKATQLS